MCMTCSLPSVLRARRMISQRPLVVINMARAAIVPRPAFGAVAFDARFLSGQDDIGCRGAFLRCVAVDAFHRDVPAMIKPRMYHPAVRRVRRGDGGHTLRSGRYFVAKRAAGK